MPARTDIPRVLIHCDCPSGGGHDGRPRFRCRIFAARGDLLEIELEIDSKNDYEHLVFEDPKAAGVEPYDVTSGYNAIGLPAYVELRDEKVALFIRRLPRGKHSLRYRMRAEIPGKFSALPTLGSAMYAPEMKANSDEMKLRIGEQ